jgi:hypothetical protein
MVERLPRALAAPIAMRRFSTALLCPMNSSSLAGRRLFSTWTSTSPSGPGSKA